MHKANDLKHKKVRLVLDFSVIILSVYALTEYGLSIDFFDGILSNNIFQSIFGIAIIAAIYIIWYIGEKSIYSSSKLFHLINIIILVLLTISTIVFTGGNDSDYKYLLILSVVSATLEVSTGCGAFVAAAATLFLFALDLIPIGTGVVLAGENTYLERDMLLCSVMFLLDYIIGYCLSKSQQHINSLQERISLDLLTGLYSFGVFQDALEKMFSEAKKNSENLSLILFDIDWFKSFNEMYGRDEGNKVLKRAGEMLLEDFGEGNVCSRYGGEEFAIVLPGIGADEAGNMADIFRSRFEKEKFKGEEFLPHGRLTISGGIAEFENNMKDYNELIRNCDEALYRAKFLRRNCTEKYSSFAYEFVYLPEEDGAKDLLPTVQALLKVISTKDKYTQMHCDRVARYCDGFAKFINMKDEDYRLLVSAAYIHDIGKITISSEVLLKREALTDDEYYDLRKHPITGSDIIRGVSEDDTVAAIIRGHHERYDGSGYPDGLKGKQIHYLARILSIADSFDAMTVDRPYKRQLKSWAQAEEEIMRCSGSQFDPEYAKKFVSFLKTVS